jgi:hypothetical protein
MIIYNIYIYQYNIYIYVLHIIVLCKTGSTTLCWRIWGVLTRYSTTSRARERGAHSLSLSRIQILAGNGQQFSWQEMQKEAPGKRAAISSPSTDQELESNSGLEKGGFGGMERESSLRPKVRYRYPSPTG